MNEEEREPPVSELELFRGWAAAGAIATLTWLLTRALTRHRRRSVAPLLPPPHAQVPPALDLVPPASMVIGSFADEGAALDAVKAVTRRWNNGYRVYSPNLNETFFEAMSLPSSPTRYWIAAGGAIGWLGGWATTIMLSIYWIHHVASMPVIAVPPFTIISFEMMVLFGAFGGVLGLMFHARLPSFEPPEEYLRRFKRDRIGVVLSCDGGGEEVLHGRALLEEHGADEILYV